MVWLKMLQKSSIKVKAWSELWLIWMIWGCHLSRTTISVRTAHPTAILMTLMKESYLQWFSTCSAIYHKPTKICCGKLRERSSKELNSRYLGDKNLSLFRKVGGFLLMSNGNTSIFLTQWVLFIKDSWRTMKELEHGTLGLEIFLAFMPLPIPQFTVTAKTLTTITAAEFKNSLLKESLILMLLHLTVPILCFWLTNLMASLGFSTWFKDLVVSAFLELSKLWTSQGLALHQLEPGIPRSPTW